MRSIVIAPRKLVRPLRLASPLVGGIGLHPQKGALALGSDADLVVVDLEKQCRFSNDMVFCGAGWSIYDGWEIKGWPVMTILRGQVMMEWPEGERRAKIVGKPIGRYIPRKLASAAST
jgi:dihydropyrimidinase